MSMPELTLTGTPSERGRAHGEALRDSIAEVLGAWRESLATETNPDNFLERLVGDTGFLDVCRARTPGLVAEVEGIAIGAGQEFATMFAWQLLDESWWYLAHLNGGLRPIERCSALAINAGGRGMVAQTQDLDRHYDNAHVMLRTIDADGREILSPSVAGLLALNGVNSAGLGVCITTLSPLAHSTDGLPSGFVVPSLLRCQSVDEALEFLRNTSLASGNSLVLGERDRSVVVEVSADDVVVASDNDRGIHTNHPTALAPVWDLELFASSHDRYDQLDRSVRADSSFNDIADMYASGAVCQSRSSDGPVVSVSTMIAELGDTQRCHVAAGPLDSEKLTTYEMIGDH